MTIELDNIGMIKEATVKVDGLTVIAGENDTGKSTLGKALFMFLNSFRVLHKIEILDDNGSKLADSMAKQEKLDNIFAPKLIFNTNLQGAEFLFSDDPNEFHLVVDEDNIILARKIIYPSSKKTYLPIFIESPLIWSFTEFFRDVAQIESQMGIKLDYPYLMKDLNFKLFIKNASDGIDIKKQIISLVGGEFKKDEMGRFFFDKQGQRIELLSTATGIKYFGIFQVLSQNNYLTDNTVLILDEPEVHLHPKWQLEMAKIIVELVKNGVKILVNSHSPYMIEALKVYSEKESIQDKTNFYLAEKDTNGMSSIKNCTHDLMAIFNLLSKPLNDLEEISFEQSMQE